LLVNCNCCCPTYLEAIPSIHNLMMCHVIVIGPTKYGLYFTNPQKQNLFNFVLGVTVQGAPTQPTICDITGSSKRRKKKKRKRRRRGVCITSVKTLVYTMVLIYTLFHEIMVGETLRIWDMLE
jgi:hypothetical protein